MDATSSMRDRAARCSELAEKLTAASLRGDWEETERVARDLLSAASKIHQRAKVMLEFAG